MKNVQYRVTALVLAALSAMLMLLPSGGLAEAMTFPNAGKALSYVKANQPMELTLEGVKFTPAELLKIRNAMPEGATLHFSTSWGKAQFTDETEDLDLTVRGTVTAADLEALIALCPRLKRIDNSNHRTPSNKEMIPLIEKYPDIQFEWVVRIGYSYYCSTMDTAFSTFQEPNTTTRLSSEQLENLKYLPRLKALDVGHNRIKTLDFLQYVPDLEMLIIGDNFVQDLTPISNLKHLQYAELFSNHFTDISPLTECTELLDLNICHNDVTDLSPLDHIDTLERLWATMIYKMPEEEKARFKEVHPNTLTDFSSTHPTGNGWRKHERNKHYIWCLRHKTWIPFNEPLPTT